MNYAVQIDSLHRNFPAGVEVPKLLLDFARWLGGQRAGSVGYFGVQGDRFDDYWIENGADLHPFFAFFLRDATGGRVGYWLSDGPTTASPPIIYVGSEGELTILSDCLEDFLHRLAIGATRVHDLDSREADTTGQEMVAWLAMQAHSPESQGHRDHPDLENWMADWGKQQREWINNSQDHLQIAEKLRKYLKPNAEVWDSANFDVVLVGSQFQIWHRRYGVKLLPTHEISELELWFRLSREQRARRFPERGLWFSAWVRVGLQGGATLCCNFMDEPKVLDECPAISRVEYERDLSIFPRSEHWLPGWLH